MLFVGATIGLLLLASGQLNRQAPLGKAWQWVQAKVQGKAVDEEDLDEHVFKKSRATPAARRQSPPPIQLPFQPQADRRQVPSRTIRASLRRQPTRWRPRYRTLKDRARNRGWELPVAVPKAGEVSALPSPGSRYGSSGRRFALRGRDAQVRRTGSRAGARAGGCRRPASGHSCAPKSTGPVVEGTQPKTVAAGPVAATPLESAGGSC